MRSSVRFVLTTMVVAGLAVVACGDDGGTTDPPETGEVRVTVETGGAAESGVTVRLFEVGGTTATDTETTGSNGRATFTSLEPGGYEVELEPPEGRELADGEDSRKSVTVVAGQRADVDFALAETGGSDVVEVRLTGNLTFEPSSVTIEPGTTIRWRNEQAMTHTVTPDGHDEWQSASLSSAGQTFEHTFTDAGEFDYFCQPHVGQGMTGTIRVQE